MKLYEKMSQKYVNNVLAGPNQMDIRAVYIEGFLAARSLAIKIWDTNDGNGSGHVYCDFFYDGRKRLEYLGEEEIVDDENG